MCLHVYTTPVKFLTDSHSLLALGVVSCPLNMLFMTTAQEASPVIDMTVRPMSTMRSTPATMATHSTGICAEANTIAIKASAPPGIPGVPIEATVEAKAMAKY